MPPSVTTPSALVILSCSALTSPKMQGLASPITSHTSTSPGPQRPSPVLRRIFADLHLGCKSGRGGR